MTHESLNRIELILSSNDYDGLKPELCSFILDNLEEFRSRRADTIYSHCPVPASIHERRVVGGKLQFSEDGKQVDCTRIQGRKIIPNLDNVTVDDMKTSTGEFILVVQRYDIFRRMVATADKFIVVNVEEELDSKTKLFLCKLKEELKLPILALVDCSPDGLKIISNVSQCCGGCDVGWTGILPSVLDAGMFSIPNNSRIRIPMTESELETLEDLMKNDVFIKEKMRDPNWFEDPVLIDKQHRNTLLRNPAFENKRKKGLKGTWSEELTLMKESGTKTKVEDFDDYMSMLYIMVILAYQQEEESS